MFRMDPYLKKQIREQAKSAKCTPEEYLKNILDTHTKNVALKEILLKDHEGFAEFVNEYTKAIDSLYFMTPTIKNTIEEQGFDESRMKVFTELAFFTARDSNLLLHLYKVYTSED